MVQQQRERDWLWENLTVYLPAQSINNMNAGCTISINLHSTFVTPGTSTDLYNPFTQ